MGWDYNWRAGGTTLDDHCTSIVLENEGGGGRDGINVRVPGVDGERSGEKTHRAVTLALRTALRWAGPDGSVTHANGQAGHIHQNLAALKRLLGNGLVELARNDPEAGELRGLVELIEDPIPGEQRHIYVWPLRLVEGSWYEASSQEATGNPPLVFTRGNRRIDDLELEFDQAAVLIHTARDGIVSELEVLDPAGGAGGYPCIVRTGQHKTVIRQVDEVNDDPYLCLDGAGGFVTTPHDITFDITDNLDLRIRLRSSWADSGGLISRYDDATNVLMWEWQLNSQKMRFRWRDSTTLYTPDRSPALNFAPNTTHWLRVTKVGANVNYYHSDDDTDDHTAVTWTLVATVASESTNNIDTGTGALHLGRIVPGAPANPSLMLEGQVFAAAVLDNVTVVASPDFTDPTEWTIGDRAGAQGDDGQANTWTLGGTATIACPQAAPGRIRVTQPWWMRFDPEFDAQALRVDGATFSVASTADKTQLDIPDELDIRVRAAQDDWAVPDGDGRPTFMAKRVTGNEWQFRTVVDRLEFVWWDDTGGGPHLITCDAGHGFVDGGIHWMRVVKSGTTITFHVSDDQTNDHSQVTWTQLGSTETTAAGDIETGASTGMTIGGSTFATESLVGRVYAAAVLDTGVVAADPIFADDSQGWEIGDDSATPDRADTAGNFWELVDTAEITADNQNITTTAPVTVRWRNRWA